MWILDSPPSKSSKKQKWWDRIFFIISFDLATSCLWYIHGPINSSLACKTVSEYIHLSIYTMPRDRDPLVVGGVVGDVLDPFTRSIGLRVIYNNRDVSNGCDLRPSLVINQPRVEIGGDDLRIFYTLVILLYKFIFLAYVCICVSNDAKRSQEGQRQPPILKIFLFSKNDKNKFIRLKMFLLSIILW